jgi:hypothetical protein
MSPEEQVDADFSRALRRAVLRKVRIRSRTDAASDELLLCFDDLRNIPGAPGRINRDFMPTTASVEERWKRIDLAFHRGEVLAPVSLYKVGGLLLRLGWPPPLLGGLLSRREGDRRLFD